MSSILVRSEDVVVLSSDDEESEKNLKNNSEDLIILNNCKEKLKSATNGKILHNILTNNDKKLPPTIDRVSVDKSDLERPKKKIKLNPVPDLDGSTNSCIILSDEDEPEKTVETNETAKDLIDKENLLNIVKVENNDLGDSEICMANKLSVQDNSHCQTNPECRSALEKFISLCMEKVEKQYQKALEDKLDVLRHTYNKVEHRQDQDMKNLKSVIEEKIQNIYDHPKLLLSIFKDLFFHLKSLYKETAVDKEKRRKLKKLYKTLLLVRAKVKSLEEAEVDFDDEENSSYIQVQRYRERAIKVYAKICELENRDPNEGRITHTRLNIQVSKYPQFNKALNKKFKNNSKFPTFYEVLKYLKRVASQFKIELSEPELTFEAKSCFEALGKKMKKRRQKELYEVSEGLIDHSASDLPEYHQESLNEIIKKHKEEADEKYEKLFQLFAMKQDLGENPKLSSDSDDSGEDQNVQSEEETAVS